MPKRYLPQRNGPLWLAGLLLVSLILAACGGAAGSAPEGSASATESEEVASPTESEEVADTPTAEVAEEEPAEAAEEETPTEEAEASQNENLLDPNASLEASCEAVEIPTNDLIAAVSDSDWVLGPEDAPVTVIEYGDFQ